MAYRLWWGNDEQTTLYLKFEGSLTWEQFYESMDAMKHVAESVNHAVTTITDVRDAEKLPLVNVLKLKPTFSNKARNTRFAIIVGLPAFQQTMVNVFTSLYKQLAGDLPIAFVDKMEDAEALAARELMKNN